MAQVTVSEAHRLLNQWYPESSHCIGINFWQHAHGNGEIVTENEYTVTTFIGTDVRKQVRGSTLDACIMQLHPTPSPSSEQVIAEADKFQRECEAASMLQQTQTIETVSDGLDNSDTRR